MPMSSRVHSSVTRSWQRMLIILAHWSFQHASLLQVVLRGIPTRWVGGLQAKACRAVGTAFAKFGRVSNCAVLGAGADGNALPLEDPAAARALKCCLYVQFATLEGFESAMACCRSRWLRVDEEGMLMPSASLLLHTVNDRV